MCESFEICKIDKIWSPVCDRYNERMKRLMFISTGVFLNTMGHPGCNHRAQLGWTGLHQSMSVMMVNT